MVGSPSVSAGDGFYISDAFEHAAYDGYPITAYQIFVLGIPVTEAPTAHELAVLRNLDPERLYIA